ncbi:hypothetical protein LOTGIDRAFT_139123 [Lottia gigantea]|uniref:RING-type domain-containing protein n=1 Tax=Lottia gigantea TaxID=225164 RepID=V4AWB1_LOTGI|nr:hypothetical protein LOTGIDRAFT_139123 [Lottia gigantea]ESP01773.1 hypothetical protein LOTGIDRAFT_139123 [Lottia gigantea]
MAAASLTNIPECSICCEDFKTPKFLPCGHTFCLDCIERYIGDKIETFHCPLCGQDVTIPVGGAKMFTTNYIAQTVSTQRPSSTTSTDTTSVIGETTSPDKTEVVGEATSHDTHNNLV